jgi:hypothetical protein
LAARPSSVGSKEEDRRNPLEFTVRIVAETDPKWLGNMAKGLQPVTVDALLQSADHGD